MTRDYSLHGNQPVDGLRRPEYVRTDEWIRDFLRRGQVAHVASRWDEQPFVTPTIYYFDEPGHRLIFHSNVAGRLRANVERHPRLCAEVSELGRLLPSNVALEFSLQYRSAVVFGAARVIAAADEQSEFLRMLIVKYFPEMRAGKDYRLPTDKELKRTSVYALEIETWSGKENWKDRAHQSDEWPALDEKWFR